MQNSEEMNPNPTTGVSIHTGFPNPATDAARRGGLNFNQLLIRNGASTFLMRITGRNWRQFGIFHDDIVIIDRALTPRHTDLVIWWKDGDFAISEFSQLDSDVVVWGVVTATIHEFRKVSRHANA